MRCGGVNGGLYVSCMLKMAEKESLSSLEGGLELRVLCIRNQNTSDRIRNELVLSHLIVDVVFVKSLALQALQLCGNFHGLRFETVASVIFDWG